MATGLAKAASVSGLIVFGTTTSLFAKIVYEIQSVGEDGTTKYFHKPWAMTSLMFIGMTCCLPLAYYQECKKRQALAEEEAPLLARAQDPKPRNELRETLLLSIPTFFDLLATILMNIGLLYVTASVYQMMRGAEMLFAALFTVTFLGRKLNRFHLLGILCCICGVILVGTSSYFGGSTSTSQVITPEQNLIGMALIVISQAVQAAQLTFEDFFMADMNIAPMKIVGWEGVFGVIGTLGIMAPIAYFLPGDEGEGIHENIIDTVTMIGNNRGLMIVLIVDCMALAFYNIMGMMVTGHLGAVFRTVLETTRTLFVWLVGLLLFYTPLGMGTLGEAWNQYSWLQAAGFCVLVAGTLVYQRGEDESCRKDMAEAMAVQAAQEPEGYVGADGHAYDPLAAPPSYTGTVHAPTVAHAIPMPGGTHMAPSTPQDMPGGSFKASHTLNMLSSSHHARTMHMPHPE